MKAAGNIVLIEKRMQNEKFDVVIPIIAADIDRIYITLPYIEKNLPVDKIVIIANSEVAAMLPTNDKIIFLDEDKVEEGMTAERIRQLVLNISEQSDFEGWYANKIFGWYFQQFLKMAYCKKCNNRAYVTWDADTLPLSRIVFTDESTDKYFFTMKTEYHLPYFETMKRLINPPLERMADASFIAENMIFDVEIMTELLKRIESNNTIDGNDWYEKIMYAVGKNGITHFSFSEFETYGNFTLKYYPDKYGMRELRSLRNGRTYLGIHPSDKKLAWAAESYDIVSFERWDRQCFFSFIWLNHIGYKCLNLRKIEDKTFEFIKSYRKLWRKIKDILKNVIKHTTGKEYVKGIGLK